jgi:predicted membrane channel-forming protein YqfA (hemolysin III family)
MTTKKNSLDSVYVPLKITFGFVPLLAGLDKFVGLLADWESYLSPWLASMLPISEATFMMIVGVIEATVGIAILTRFTRLGAYVAMGWLVLISFNLLLVGALDIAVRDLVMAVAAYSLGTISGLMGLEWWPGFSRSEGVEFHAPTAS